MATPFAGVVARSSTKLLGLVALCAFAGCGGTFVHQAVGSVCTPILEKLYTHPPCGGTSGCGVHTGLIDLSFKVFVPSPRRERLPREGGIFGW